MSRAPRRAKSSVFLEVFAVGQAVRELLLTTMADGPLSPEDYAVYSVVFESEALTPTAMGERLGMPLTTVMERVRVMETRRHVRRIANAADGRSYLLVLTAAGLAAHRGANARFEVAYRAFLEALPGSERRVHTALVEVRTAAAHATSRVGKKTSSLK